MATLLGQPFHCHKTVHSKAVARDMDDDAEQPPSYHRAYQQCAGATEWARAFTKEHGRSLLVDGKLEENGGD